MIRKQGMNRQDEQGICIRAHLTCKEKKKKKVIYYHFILDLGLLIYPKTTSHPPSALQFIHGLSPRPKEEASRISRYTLFLQCCLFICPVDFFYRYPSSLVLRTVFKIVFIASFFRSSCNNLWHGVCFSLASLRG